jgi:hypothetical protein
MKRGAGRLGLFLVAAIAAMGLPQRPLTIQFRQPRKERCDHNWRTFRASEI